MRKDFLDRPLYYRLVPNSHSMSTTRIGAQRYMKLYTYLPAAVHPNLRSALLIYFGFGSTAKALVDTEQLRSIDIVDISREVIATSNIVYSEPSTNPLHDPRVSVHIEDGRFFLLATPKRYDLITAEPPPLAQSGVENLYTQEYFQLLYDRLNEGGMVTCWLPVYQLDADSTKAILAAFAGVFDDCSLWTGKLFEWMLVGTRNARGPVSKAMFCRQWEDERVRQSLDAAGFERPESIGATFLMDAAGIASIIRNAPPLIDNYPKRLQSSGPSRSDYSWYAQQMDVDRAREQFANSPLIERLWPPAIKESTLQQFFLQHAVNVTFVKSSSLNSIASLSSIAELHQLLSQSSLRTPVCWLLGSETAQQQIVQEALREGLPPDGTMYCHMAAGAAADRNYLLAEKYLARAQEMLLDGGLVYLRIYFLNLAGKPQAARKLAGACPPSIINNRESARFWKFLKTTFGFSIHFAQ